MKDYNHPVLPTFYADCSKVTEEYEKLCGRWGLDSQLLHVITEITELKDVLRNKKEKYGRIGTQEYFDKLMDELADVFLTTFATANYLKVDVNVLNSALIKKLNIVEQRVKELKCKVS